MYSYGATSLERLATVHEDLQKLANEVIKYRDVTILCGHRGEAEQNAAFNSHASKKRFPNSKHNKQPSLAVDMCPWPIPKYAMTPTTSADFKDCRDFWVGWGNFVLGVAAVLGIKIRWGGDWNMDWSPDGFFDGPHFELMEVE